MPLDGHIFIIDCTKVAEYPDAVVSAEKIAERVRVKAPMMVGNVCLGQVMKVEQEGPFVRIYVELDTRIEHGTYQGG